MCGQWDKVQNVLITDPGISKHSMDDGFYYFPLFLPLVKLLKLQDIRYSFSSYKTSSALVKLVV